MRLNYALFLWLSLLLPFLFGSLTIADTVELDAKDSTKKNIKSLLKKMVYMEGGTFISGITSDEVNMTLSDSTLFSTGIPKRSNVDPFFLSATEITNGEWREFYQDKVIELGEERGKREYYPDTSLWVKEFPYSYNKPMADNYFSHQKFNDYPVVGISWDQANEYCHWKSHKLNLLLKKKGIESSIEFRLPTSIEWEYAALKRDKKPNPRKHQYYPWSEENGIGQINELANIGQIHDINNVILKGYGDDGCLYTCEVASYPPTNSGIFDMGGNVSEWTSNRGYTVSSDLDKNEKVIFKRLGSRNEVEKEIELLQNKLDIDIEIAKLFLKRLNHDKIVMTRNNIKICKGGNWASGMIYAQAGSRQGISKDKPSSKIGFRIAVSNVSEDVKKYFPKKKWKP